jgi:hypothetical protein
VRGTEQGIINAGHKGLRIAAVMQPTAIDGHAEHPETPETNLSLADYAQAGAFSLRNATTQKRNPSSLVVRKTRPLLAPSSN